MQRTGFPQPETQPITLPETLQRNKGEPEKNIHIPAAFNSRQYNHNDPYHTNSNQHISNSAQTLKNQTQDNIHLKFKLNANIHSFEKSSQPHNCKSETGIHPQSDQDGDSWELHQLIGFARSNIDSQRCIGLRVITFIIRNLYQGEHAANEIDVYTNEITAYVLSVFSNLDLLVVIRISLDSPHATVMQTAIECMSAYFGSVSLKCKYDWADLNLQRTLMRGNGGLAMDISSIDWFEYSCGFTSSKPTRVVITETESASPTDMREIRLLLSRDCVSGILATTILPRFNYILSKNPAGEQIESVMGVLIRIAMHSTQSAEEVLATAGLVDELRRLYRNEMFRVVIAQLFYFLAKSSRECCEALVKSGIIPDLVCIEANSLTPAASWVVSILSVCFSYGLESHFLSHHALYHQILTRTIDLKLDRTKSDLMLMNALVCMLTTALKSFPVFMTTKYPSGDCYMTPFVSTLVAFVDESECDFKVNKNAYTASIRLLQLYRMKSGDLQAVFSVDLKFRQMLLINIAPLLTILKVSNGAMNLFPKGAGILTTKMIDFAGCLLELSETCMFIHENLAIMNTEQMRCVWLQEFVKSVLKSLENHGWINVYTGGVTIFLAKYGELILEMDGCDEILTQLAVDCLRATVLRGVPGDEYIVSQALKTLVNHHCKTSLSSTLDAFIEGRIISADAISYSKCVDGVDAEQLGWPSCIMYASLGTIGSLPVKKEWVYKILEDIYAESRTEDGSTKDYSAVISDWVMLSKSIDPAIPSGVDDRTTESATLRLISLMHIFLIPQDSHAPTQTSTYLRKQHVNTAGVFNGSHVSHQISMYTLYQSLVDTCISTFIDPVFMDYLALFVDMTWPVDYRLYFYSRTARFIGMVKWEFLEFKGIEGCLGGACEPDDDALIKKYLYPRETNPEMLRVYNSMLSTNRIGSGGTKVLNYIARHHTGKLTE